MDREVELVVATGGFYRARLRECTDHDASLIAATWAPMIERGPSHWPDADWAWEALAHEGELAFAVDPEWLVISDEIEDGASGLALGTVVTTCPILAGDFANAGLDPQTVGNESLLWLEAIAVAPWLRPDCPKPDRRDPLLRGIGPHLRRAAIERSMRLGCGGRVALHADGPVAVTAYTKWGMVELPLAAHPKGGSYPLFFGDAQWAQGILGTAVQEGVR